jgi:fluoride exporter
VSRGRHPGRTRAATPAYLRPGPVFLFLVGGTLGTAVRAAVEGAVPYVEGEMPWATFGINVSGALLLGLLVEAVALHRARRRTAHRLRLLLGTGVLGGYTTYSTFVLETVLLGTGERLFLALIYDAATLVAGFLAALVAMTAYRGWRIGREAAERGARA